MVDVVSVTKTEATAILLESTKYLPPTSVEDVVVPIIVGAILAGLAWRVNVV